ncbi:MAG: hypothetical protein ACK500_13865 [Flavobacteriales bacterium]|jgi:hypothetical protein
MVFNFSTLSTAIACDALLTDAQRDKTALQNRKNSLEFQIQNDSTDGGLASELADVVAELAALDTAIAALPEGTVRANMEVDRIQVDLRRARLQLRIDNADAYGEVNRQYDLAQVDARIEAIDVYITELTAYRDALPAAPAEAA